MRTKHIPSDFIVQEILPDDLIGRDGGQFFLLSFTKSGRNTEDVVQDVSHALRLPRKSLGICGNKDRHAVTTQYLSVARQPLGQIKPETLLGKMAGVKDTSFSFQSFIDRPLSLGLLAGNRFTITVRDLDSAELSSMQHIARQTTNNKQQAANNERRTTHHKLPIAIPNYFDSQRFSEHNLAAGRALVKKDFAAAARIIFPEMATANPVMELRRLPKKTLLMYVHAYQSWIWNETAAAYLKSVRGVKIREVQYGEGIFRFPDAMRKGMKDVKVPLVGFGTEVDAIRPASLKNIIQRILEKEGITPMDFVVRQVPEITSEGGERNLLISVSDFSTKTEDDELFQGKKKATLSFTLPPGSYATIAVKALFV